MVKNKSEWCAASEDKESSGADDNKEEEADEKEKTVKEESSSSSAAPRGGGDDDRNSGGDGGEVDPEKHGDAEDAAAGVDDDDDEDDDDDSSASAFFFLQPGDHVYSWCSFLGIPHAYQHHGIVIDVDVVVVRRRNDDSGSGKEKEEEGTVTILDFSCLVDADDADDEKRLASSTISRSSVHDDDDDDDATSSIITPSSSSVSGSGANGGDYNHNINSFAGILREYTIGVDRAKALWKKVRYGAPWTTVVSKRSGTVSKAVSDPVETVLARTEFLIRNHRILLSTYKVSVSNCEHVAVWCKTGRFSSLQFASFMRQSIALSTIPVVAASTAPIATTTVVVPAAGIWGSWFGFTVTSTAAVPLFTVMPWLIPAAVLIPAVSVGRTYYDLRRWNQTTERLNKNFDFETTEGGKPPSPPVLHKKSPSSSSFPPAATAAAFVVVDDEEEKVAEGDLIRV